MLAVLVNPGTSCALSPDSLKTFKTLQLSFGYKLSGVTAASLWKEAAVTQARYQLDIYVTKSIRALICLSSIAFQEAFRNVGWSIVKVSVMMVGEFEYLTSFVESIGSNNEHTGNPLNPFPEIAVTFVFLFLLLMSIILMNLLVGNLTLILKLLYLCYLFIYLFATSVLLCFALPQKHLLSYSFNASLSK